MTTRAEEARPAAPLHEAHFASLAQQRSAARLGMWVFLASEILLFSTLISLYAGERARNPLGFLQGMHHADVVVGSLNTVVLLASSYLVARAVHALRAGQRRFAGRATAGTILLAFVFLGLKGWEYFQHVREGAVPGGHTQFYVDHPVPGLVSYFNLYWITTSLHALHVIVGASVLAVLAIEMKRGALRAENAHRLEIGALYWHLVDAIWIFLWPLFYLMR